MHPYTQTSNGDYIIREFSPNVQSDELVWHRDRNNRVVEVLSGTNWGLQMEDKLPMELKVGDVLEIKAETYHRVFKGIDTLKLKIKE